MKKQIKLSQLSKVTQAKIRAHLSLSAKTNQADLTPLESPDLEKIGKLITKTIREATGLKADFTVEYINGKPLKVSSDNLIDQLRIRELFSALHIINGTGGVVNEKTSTLKIPLKWEWTYPNGGSNGNYLVDIICDFSGKEIETK